MFFPYFASIQLFSICRDTLTVYDSFPLINGLMFQSPNPYTEQLTPNDYEPPHVSTTHPI